MIHPEFWKNRRVFLTGHTGFKGAWTALWLTQMGADVTGYALAPETQPNLFSALNLDGEMKALTGDIRDQKRLTAAFQECKPEVVIHMAAQALVRRSYRDPVDTYETNVMGTVHLLESVRLHGADTKAVIVVTSDKCYENKEMIWGYRETDAMGGHDPYSNSKGCAELVVDSDRRSFFKPIASARAGNVVGGGDWSEDRLIPDIIKAFTQKQTVKIRNPQATRPWQFVLEPVAGYLMLAEALYVDDEAHFASGWNFGPADSEVQNVERIVRRMSELWGPKAKWEKDNSSHPHEAHYLKLDCTKAQQILGWKPTLTLNQTLEWIVEWYKVFDEDSTRARGLCTQQIQSFNSLAQKAHHES